MIRSHPPQLLYSRTSRIQLALDGVLAVAIFESRSERSILSIMRADFKRIFVQGLSVPVPVKLPQATWSSERLAVGIDQESVKSDLDRLGKLIALRCPTCRSRPARNCKPQDCIAKGAAPLVREQSFLCKKSCCGCPSAPHTTRAIWLVPTALPSCGVLLFRKQVAEREIVDNVLNFSDFVFDTYQIISLGLQGDLMVFTDRHCAVGGCHF